MKKRSNQDWPCRAKISPSQLEALAPTAEARPLFLPNLPLVLLVPAGRKLCCVAFLGNVRSYPITSDRALVTEQRNEYAKSLG